MKNPQKKQILSGFTNKTFLVEKNQKFFIHQEKIDNGFNHQINYNLLSKFSFVPKLIEENKVFLDWEFIPYQTTIKSDLAINKISVILKELHGSKLNFPQNNLLSRQNYYLKVAKEINGSVIPKEIKEYWDLSIILHQKLDVDVPIHSDPWLNNFIGQPPNEKIFLIDWEYAVMGDKHWDLAYFIDSALLNKRETILFLKAYGPYDKKKLAIASFLVNFISVIWLFQYQDYKKMFSFKPLLEKVKNLYPSLNQEYGS